MGTTPTRLHQSDRERIAALEQAQRAVHALQIALGEAAADAVQSLARVNDIRRHLATARAELAGLVEAVCKAA